MPALAPAGRLLLFLDVEAGLSGGEREVVVAAACVIGFEEGRELGDEVGADVLVV